MKRTLIRLGLAALVSTALFGCGGGSDGVNSTSVITVPIGPSTVGSTVASNASTPSSQSVQAWRALQPTVTITGVSINSPPVVRFAVTDANGAAVVGLGNKSQGTSSSSSSVAALTNLRFTIAKLVPATATEPSKWVSYLVLKPPTVAQATAGSTLLASDSCTADRKWCGTYPTTDSEGTLVDNGDGTYKYTFARDITQAAAIVASLVDSTDGSKLKADLGDVSYDPSLTHRVGIQISGAAPGTGTNVPNATQVIAGVNIDIPTNMYYDFRPDGQTVSSTRNVVDVTSCDSCHNGKGLAHGGGRKDPNFCVTCHTDQAKYGMSTNYVPTANVLPAATNIAVVDGRAIANFPNFAHKIHMGSELSLSGYAYKPGSGAAMTFTDVEWIQDPRNCAKCHSGADKTDINQATKTKDGDNWKTKPSRLACGACHDNVNFATGVITESTGTSNHAAGPAADDSTCNTCHTSAVIAESHRTESPTANNPTQIDGISSITYEIKSVAVDSTTKVPSITFRIVKDGAPVTTFNTPTPVLSASGYSVPSTFEPITGFRSGVSLYVAYAVPQDGITAPADFNTYQSVSLNNLLITSGSPKGGTLTGPDADGYWVATLTGDTTGLAPTGACVFDSTKHIAGKCVNPSPIKIPTAAKMVTGAIIGNFTQNVFTGSNAAALTAKWNTIVSGSNYLNGTSTPGVIIKTPLQKLVATGYTARRVAVDTAKCESCHEQLGTAVEFHGGARNDGTSCAICHNTNRTSGGWSANASTFIHGIHAGTDPASVTAITGSGGPGIAAVGYPGKGGGGAGTSYSSGKRTIPFSWHRDTAPTATGQAGFNAAANVYPGILKGCGDCHVPNAVNFGLNGTTLLPNLLWTSSATGTYSATDNPKVYARDPVTGALKYIATGSGATNNYGNLFGFTPEGSVVPKYTTSSNTTLTGAVFTNALSTSYTNVNPAGAAVTSGFLSVAGAGGVVARADQKTLIESPVTAACVACHDSSTAKLHFSTYGGVFYGKRQDSDSTFPTNATYSGILVNKETCLICHGYGRDQDAAVVHAK